MTNAEALLARVGYPLSDNAIQMALEKRGMSVDDDYVALEDVQSFDLAYADCLFVVIASPASFSEGGMSVTSADVNRLIEMANFIYKKYGEVSPIKDTLRPIARFVNRW